MIVLTHTIRSLLILAVVVTTGPWCCCSSASAMPTESQSQPDVHAVSENHGCCPSDKKTPDHLPHHKDGACKGSCDLIASTPNMAGHTVVGTADRDGNPIVTPVVVVASPLAIDVTTPIATFQPLAYPVPVLRSLYALNCQLTV